MLFFYALNKTNSLKEVFEMHLIKQTSESLVSRNIIYSGVMALLTFAVIIATFFPGIAKAQSNACWWQREEPNPSCNQVINPDYVEKKRELEQAWDVYQKSLQAERHFRSLGQNTTVIRRAIRINKKKVEELELELSKIPVYITNEEFK